ncbi:MAG: family 20 glycosylhydrolase [Thaumarchaeota archaeon]|nr:family 20 glycosylhydrolase [Nitrososphaerota archaeon]
MLRTFKFLLLVLVAQIISFNSLTSFIFVRASTENYSYLKIVPEPKFLNFTGRWFQFDGFYNFPSFLREAFNVSRGNWKLVNTTLPSSFTSYVRIKNGVVEVSGDLNVAYATVLQLIKQRPGYLPEVEVGEALNFKFIGFHLDVARGGVPRVETFKDLLNFLFLLKYNYLGIYLEDLFPWENYPEIGSNRGKFTREELSEIVNYGKRLGVEVFPSLELSGHMNNILSIPSLSKYSLNGNTFQLDISNKEARNFGYSLLDEVVNFWPSSYIHIGGDENQLDGVSGAQKLYESYYKGLIDIVKSKGKTPIMWGDALLWTWPDLANSTTWKNVIIANWDYGTASKEHFIDNIRFFKDKNITQIISPGLWNWNAFYPSFDAALINLNSSLTAARDEGIFGFLITAWGDDGCECLLSYLRPLLLISMEIAEGKGNWEETWLDKWVALTGESKEVAEARVKLGSAIIFRNLKSLLFKGSTVDSGAISFMESILDSISKVELPRDLSFIRAMLSAAIKRSEGKLTSDEVSDLEKAYSSLWLGERKPEGLDYNLQKFQNIAEQMKSEKLRQTTILLSVFLVVVVALVIGIKLFYSR